MDRDPNTFRNNDDQVADEAAAIISGRKNTGNRQSQKSTIDKSATKGPQRILCFGATHFRDFISKYIIACLEDFREVLLVIMPIPQEKNEKFFKLDYYIDILIEDGKSGDGKSGYFVQVERKSTERKFKQAYLTASTRGRTRRIRLIVVPGELLMHPRHIEPKDLELDQKFRLIFCCFSLHIIQNWRVTLANLLRLLGKGGRLCYGEVTGEFKLMDGHLGDKFQRPDSESTDKGKDLALLHELIETFNDLRSQQNFYWRPELRMSDHGELCKTLRSLFENIIDYDLENATDHYLPWEFLVEDWMKEGRMSYFRIGIDYQVVSANTPSVLAQLKSAVKSHTDKNFKINKGVRLIIAENFRGEDDFSHADLWDYSCLQDKLQEIDDKAFVAIAKKALDILSSHDIFLPSITRYCAILGWDENKQTRQSPVLVAVNTDGGSAQQKATLDLFAKYLAHKEGLSQLDVHQFIFEYMRGKFPITIRCTDQEPIVELTGNPSNIEVFEIACTFTEDVSGKLVFFFHWDDRGLIRRLDIWLPRLYRLSPDYSLPVEAAITSRHVHYYRDETVDQHADIKIDDKNITRYVFDKATIKTFSDHFGFEANFGVFNERAYDNVPLEEVAKRMGFAPRSIDIQHWLMVLYTIATLQLPSDDDIIKFFPSGIIKKNEAMKGLGGITLYEHYAWNKLSPAFKQLMEARDQALMRASNQIFYKVSIANYVDRDYIDKALRAAVAAVISRNGSHGLGSHVLPAVAHHAQNPTENQLLFSYIEQRLDFIAQVASEFPTWTFPTWFNNNLMMRLYLQRPLLKTLVESEEIGAFEFPVDGQLTEIEWKDIEAYDKDRSFKYAVGDRLAIRGYVRQVEKTAADNLFCLELQPIHPDIDTTGQHRLFVKFHPSVFEGLRRPEVILRHRKLLVTGKLGWRNGRPCLEDGALIQHKLIIKINKRFFQDFDVNQPKVIDDNLRPYSKCFDHSVDAGKESSLFDILESEKRIQYEKPTTYIYGVISFVDWHEDQLRSIILLSPIKLSCPDHIQVPDLLDDVGLYCRMSMKQRIDQHHKEYIEVGRRVYLTGKLVKTKKSLVLKNAEIVETVHFRYLVGNKLTSLPNDRLSDDILIAVPGGVIGYQALYTLLENVIRNSAKHDWQRLTREERLGKNLEIHIELEEKYHQDYISCRIYTNAFDLRYAQGGALATTDTIKKEFKNGVILGEPYREPHIKGEILSPNYPLHHSLNRLLKNSILDETGELEKRHLGLAEIRIAAGYLSRQPLRIIGGETDKTILMGRMKTEEEGFIRASAVWQAVGRDLVPRLGYRLKLLKPKELLILADEAYIKQKRELKNKLHKPGLGIEIYSFQAQIQDRLQIDHEICVIALDTLPDEWRDSPNYLISLLGRLYEACKAGKLIDERVIEALFITLERYPYRLIISMPASALWKNIPWPDPSQPSPLPFIRQRIDFVDKEKVKFDKIERADKHNYLEALEEFKLTTYLDWVLHCKRNLVIGHLNFEMYFDLGLHEGSSENKEISRGDIIGAYENFGQVILKDFKTDSHYENIRALQSIQIDRLRFNSLTVFIDQWLQQGAPLTKQEHHFYSQRLFKAFLKYFFIYKDLFNKPLTRIETLPPIFDSRPKTSDSTPENTGDRLSNGEWKKYLNDILGRHLGSNQLELPLKTRPVAKRVIAYIRHGGLDRDDYYFTNYLSGSQIFFSNLKELPDPQRRRYSFNKLMLQLYENAFPRLMVIDERIHEFVFRNHVYNFLNRQQIIVPYSLNLQVDGETTDILPNLYTPEGSVRKLCIRLFGSNDVLLNIYYTSIDSPSAGEEQPYAHRISHLIIHQALLENILKKCRPSIGGEEVNSKKMDRVIRDIKLEYIPNIIITSGKGKPAEMSRYCRFLPFSNLETFLMQRYPEKFLLTQILLKAIEKNEYVTTVS